MVKKTYDKVWFKRKVNFPTSIITYEFKIVEIQGEFYIYIDDRYPHWGYNGRTGPFSSFEESMQVLQEDLGSNFPNMKNKLRKQVKNLNGPVGCSLGLLLFAAYLGLFLISVQFVDGGLNALGIEDDDSMITLFLVGILNILVIYHFSKRKKKN